MSCRFEQVFLSLHPRSTEVTLDRDRCGFSSWSRRGFSSWSQICNISFINSLSIDDDVIVIIIAIIIIVIAIFKVVVVVIITIIIERNGDWLSAIIGKRCPAWSPPRCEILS